MCLCVSQSDDLSSDEFCSHKDFQTYYSFKIVFGTNDLNAERENLILKKGPVQKQQLDENNNNKKHYSMP